MISPGFAQRTPEYFVPHDWDRVTKRYVHEVNAFNGGALTHLGPAWQEPSVLEDIAAKWVVSVPVTSITSAATTATVTTTHDHGLVSGQLVSIHGAAGSDGPVPGHDETYYNGDYPATVTGANTFTYTFAGSGTSPATGTIVCSIQAHVIANRMVTTLGPGLVLASFLTTYAHPELEVGDAIVFQTDAFTVKDPVSEAAIAGKRWVLGVVQAINDMMGRSLIVWIRSLSDVVPTLAAAYRVGFAPAGPMCRVYNTSDQVLNNATPNWGENITFDSETTDVDDIHSLSTDTERITIKKAGRYLVTARVHYKSLGGGGTASVTVVPSSPPAGSFDTRGYGQHFLPASAPAEGTFEINQVWDFVPGEYVYLSASEGTAPTFITIVGGVADTWLSVTQIL